MPARVVIQDASLDWEGDWVSTQQYVSGDVVYRDGSSYRAAANTIGEDPLDFPNVWEVVALRGEMGPQGLPGPPGTPGIAQTLIIDMPPAAVWEHEHGLDAYPSITTIDSSGRRVYGDEEYPDAMTVRITFSAAMGGRLLLN